MKNKFLVIGERCDDEFIYGKSIRLSPEVPVPIFEPTRTIVVHGMAMNVYQNLIALLKNERCNDEIYHLTSSHAATKTRYVDEKTNHYFLRVDSGDANYERIDITDYKYNKSINDANIILISDYNKGYLTEDDIVDISRYASDHAHIFLDTKKPLTERILNVVDYVKINEKEYNNNLNVIPQELFEYEKKIIITKGDKGAEYCSKLYPTQGNVTMDVSGAGDTFLAALAFKYAMSFNIHDSIIFANKISSIVVNKRGVSTI